MTASFMIGAVKKIVGGFTLAQMIAIGVVTAAAVVVGLLIGALIFYRSGLRKGKRQGLKDAVSIAMKKAEEKSAATIAECEDLKKQLEALKKGEKTPEQTEKSGD